MKYKTEAIWEKFSPQIKSFIRKRIPENSVSDDILQEIFKKIHLSINTLNDDSKVESWIYQITRNTITDHYRKKKETDELSPKISVSDNTLQKIDCKSGVTSIRAIIETLPQPYAQALILTEFEGLTQKELAQKLGISIPGAKSRVQRGRKMLKAELDKCCCIKFNQHGKIIDYQCSEYFLSWYKKL